MPRFTPNEILASYNSISKLNSNFTDISNLFEKCLLRDGTAPNSMLTLLDMNHFQIQNLADAVANTDAVNLQQLNDAVSLWVATVTATKDAALASQNAAAASAGQAAASATAAQEAQSSILSALSGTTLTNASLNAASRPILAALNHAPGLPAILTEAGLEGVFEPNNVNLSAQVTNDPNQINYVAYSSDPTGASGAWVRVKLNGGRLSKVFTESLPLGDIALPAHFNNQLGLTPYWDGSQVQWPRNPYDVIDFTKYATGINHYYLNAAGNDANNGTSSGTAWRTIDHAFATMVSPAVLHLTDDYVGTIGINTSTTKTFSGMLKIKGEGPTTGRTRLLARRGNENVATFAWAASGGNGAYVSTVAAALRNYHAMFDANYLNAKGIPRPITAAPDAATCQATPGTFFYDGSTSLYVHMWDGRIPDPDNGWLYSEPAFGTFRVAQGLTTSGGVILLENLEFFFNPGAGSAAGQRLQCATTGVSNMIRHGRRNCLVYGAAGNGFENYDGSITVNDNCHAYYNRIDNHNYHSFVTTGSRGSFITVYEHNCTSKGAGFGGWTNQDALSTSANGSTSHDAINIIRTNGSYYDTNGAVVADVNGVVSVNLNVQAGHPNAGGSASPRSLFWHDNTLAAGTYNGMYLWGCGGMDDGDPLTNLLDMTKQSGGGGVNGQIYVKFWRGQTNGNVIGTLQDWNGVAV